MRIWMDKQEEYKRYMKKCEMTGNKMFKFINNGNEIILDKYIESEEKDRLLKIPDFVDRVGELAFNRVKQRLKIAGSNLTEISFGYYLGDRLELNNLDTSKVASMDSMFFYCTNLEELDLTNFNTSNVETMDNMFIGCSKLKSLDLSSFDTSKVKGMRWMFSGCSDLEELDLRGWDISNVSGSGRMFYGCNSLKTIVTNRYTKAWLKECSWFNNLHKGVEIIVK